MSTSSVDKCSTNSRVSRDSYSLWPILPKDVDDIYPNRNMHFLLQKCSIFTVEKTPTLFFPSSHLILISPSLYRLQQNDPSLAWLSWTLAQKRDLDFAFYPWPVWLKTQSTGLMPSLLCIPTWHILRCFYSKTIKDPELLLSFQFWTALALWPYQPNRLALVRVTTWCCCDSASIPNNMLGLRWPFIVVLLLSGP